MIRIDLPISKTTFKLDEETIKANSLSVVYTDVNNITDIADTTGDKDALSISAVVQDIYNGSIDISKILSNPEKKPIEKAQVSGITDKTYTGKAITQNLTVTLGGKTLSNGQDYEVSYKNNINAGTASVIITGKGKYKNSITKTFKINKAANKFKIKGAKRKVKAGKKVSGVKVTNKGTGKKLFKIKAVKKKKYKKYFKINSKTGKIKVSKKTPKGKYIVTVKAKAEATNNYKASDWKIAKVKITVK